MRGLVILFGLVLLPGAVAAQAERHTGFMVHQLNVCPQQNMAELNRLTAAAVPILEKLQEEGMIRAWYDIRHAWGDEWNVGFVTVAESHRAWLDYWNEFVSRMNKSDPDWFSRVTGLCTMHKDNFYSIRDSRSGGRE